MTKKEVTTIDALFSSKTRVKLLHLFFNNPGKSFYVREITRLIDEQINSVRRELANLMSVSVITSATADNKLFYEVNQRYEFYAPFREIFAGKTDKSTSTRQPLEKSAHTWHTKLSSEKSIRVAVIGGALVEGSASPIDLLIVGSLTPAKLKTTVADIEQHEGREIHYSQMSYDDFYYRLSVRDRFLNEIINNKHEVVVDVDRVLEKV